MAIAEMTRTRTNNPISLLEQIAGSNDWAFDRGSEDELTLNVAGAWTDYHVSLNWRHDLETLHIACAFDAKIPDNRLAESIASLRKSMSSCGSAISMSGPKNA